MSLRSMKLVELETDGYSCVLLGSCQAIVEGHPMPLARTADLVSAAYQAGSGLPAFNVITLESAEAIVAGAETANRPVILQISENAVKFHHGRLAPIAAASTAVAAAAAV